MEKKHKSERNGSREIICPICEKKFRRCNAEVKNIKNPTCSYACSKLMRKEKQKGENNPHWKGGRIAFQDRFMIYAPEHPGAKLSGGTYILEYRLIAEQKIGRQLKDNEVVHHINGNVTDNRLENLEIMTQAEHARIHTTERHKLANGKHFREVKCQRYHTN